VTTDSFKGRLLRDIGVFIIDEIGMLHMDAVEAVNLLLKDLHDTSVRFGRVLFIFGGDVHQIMPIVRGADPLGRRQAEASFFFSGDVRHCETITLTENMRVGEGERHFLDWQRKVGEDRYVHVAFPHDTRHQLSRYIAVPRHFARYDEEAFIREVYSSEVLTGDPMLLTKRVLLAPTNRIVDTLNTRITGMLPAERRTHTYLSANTPDAYDVCDPQNAVLSPDNLQQINPASLPRHRLTLTVGMPVMCMRNLDVPHGICNGTLMVVERLDSAVVWCRVNTRFGQRLHPVAPINFNYSKGGLRFTRSQMPLRVAFASTINRAQGGTYHKVGYHSLHPVWAHGMAYTAITRVDSPDGLSILCDPSLNYTHRGEELPTMRNVAPLG
jgi:hypothetical protein